MTRWLLFRMLAAGLAVMEAACAAESPTAREIVPDLVRNGNFSGRYFPTTRPGPDGPFKLRVWDLDDPAGRVRDLIPEKGYVFQFENDALRLVFEPGNREVSLTQTTPRDMLAAYRVSARIRLVRGAPVTLRADWLPEAPGEPPSAHCAEPGQWRDLSVTFSLPAAAECIRVSLGVPATADDVTEVLVERVCLWPIPGSSAGPGARPLAVAGPTGSVPLERLYVAPDPTPREAEAAFDLRRELHALAGLTLPVLLLPERQEDRVPAGSVWLGRAAAAAGALCPGRPLDAVRPGGYRLQVTNHTVLIHAHDDRGAMAGAWRLLERVGVRYYAPTVVTRSPPDRLVLEVMDETRNPTFEFSTVLHAEWSGADVRRLGFTELNGIMGDPREFNERAAWCHTANYLVPYARYHEAHPEYFAMDQEGRRLTRRPGQSWHAFETHLCLSNPEVRRLAAEQVLQWIERQPDRLCYVVSPGDGMEWCQCPACRALDPEPGHYTDRNLEFVNSIARAVAARYPDKRILTLAYTAATERPPVRVEPEPNVGILYCTWTWCRTHGLCQRNLKKAPQLVEWLRRYPGRIYVFDYPKNVYALADRARYFADLGIRGIHYCGFDFEFPDLQAWLASRLAWDRRLNVESAIDEFMGAYYGAAAEPMRQYFNWLQAAYFRSFPHRDGELGRLIGLKPADRSILDLEEADRAHAWIRQALERVSDDPDCTRRIQAEQYRLLIADLNVRNRAGCQTDSDRAAYAERLTAFLRLARQRHAPTVFYNTAMTEWLAETAQLVLAPGGVAWQRDPRLDAFLADPMSHLAREERFQKKIPAGWALDVAGFQGGEGPRMYANQCPGRLAVWVQRAGSPRSKMSMAFYLDTAPRGAARLTLEGQDDDAPDRSTIEILINHMAIFRGENQFAERNWSTQSFAIPAGTLTQGRNMLEIINLTTERGDRRDALNADKHLEDAGKQDASYSWGWCMLSGAAIEGLE